MRSQQHFMGLSVSSMPYDIHRTKPLSLYRKFPESLSLPLPEGPNSGILVIQDEESETTTCFGLCKNRDIRELPIPQNKEITIRYSSGSGENQSTSYYYVMPIPILNQPLSSNLFYITQVHGKHAGESYTSSKEEDMGTCCFCNYIKDVKTRPLDHRDIYQQFQIAQCEPSCGASTGFYAKSVASDGFPPYFLRRKGWRVSTKTPKNYELTEALGLNTTIRARLPDFNFPLSYKNSEAVVVGKWYSPFIFIRDGTLKDQSKTSPYYEVTLEQNWEQIFTRENYYGEGNVVAVNFDVQAEVVSVAGREAFLDKQNTGDGVMWFTSAETRVGLNSVVVERMKWEQERVGWTKGSDKKTTVKRTDEYEGRSVWKRYGCYILVERFVLKRMDGSLLLTYEFKHSHRINSKWE